MKDSSGSKPASPEALPEQDLSGTDTAQPEQLDKLHYITVPLMLLCSSAIMATAWLGHLRYKEDLTFLMATLFAWCLVLPEYALNILALRIGYKEFTGGQMGAFRLCTGVFCIAMVSIYVLGEHMTMQKVIGFAIMGLSMILISSSDKKNEEQ